MTQRDREAASDPFDTLTAADFRPLVGTGVRFAGAKVALTLMEVDESSHEPPHGHQRKGFILLFRGPPIRGAGAGDMLPEGLHRCTFEDGTVQDIYIAPIHTPEPGHQNYQAVFN